MLFPTSVIGNRFDYLLIFSQCITLVFKLTVCINILHIHCHSYCHCHCQISQSMERKFSHGLTASLNNDADASISSGRFS